MEAPSDETVEEEGYHPIVIAETTKPLHRLSVSDAVMQLDLTGAPALVFIHASTGRMNVVYRRGDGAIGWVDPPLGRALTGVTPSWPGFACELCEELP